MKVNNCGVHEARVVRKTHDGIELLIIFEGTNVHNMVLT